MVVNNLRDASTSTEPIVFGRWRLQVSIGRTKSIDLYTNPIFEIIDILNKIYNNSIVYAGQVGAEHDRRSDIAVVVAILPFAIFKKFPNERIYSMPNYLGYL